MEKYQSGLERYEQQIKVWYATLKEYVSKQGFTHIVVSGESGIISRRLAEILFPDIPILYIDSDLNKRIQRIGFDGIDLYEVELELEEEFPMLFEDGSYPLLLDDHAHHLSKSFLYSFSFSYIGIRRHKVLPVFSAITDLAEAAGVIDGLALTLRDSPFYNKADDYMFIDKLVLDIVGGEYAPQLSYAMRELASRINNVEDKKGLVEESLFIQYAKEVVDTAN